MRAQVFLILFGVVPAGCACVSDGRDLLECCDAKSNVSVFVMCVCVIQYVCHMCVCVCVCHVSVCVYVCFVCESVSVVYLFCLCVLCMRSLPV